MQRYLNIVLFAACVMVCCSAARAGEAAASGTKVAIVRIQDAFEQYDRTKAMKKSIEDAFKPQQENLDKLKAQIEELNNALRKDQMIEAGSYKWFEKMQEIKTKRFLYETLDKQMRKDWNDMMVQFYQTIYKDFQAAVREYAESARVDVVLRSADEDLKNDSAIGIQNEIGMKIVHYFRPSLDITEQVVQVMNRRYRASGAAKR